MMWLSPSEEIWKAIPGCDGYEASDLGRIRSRGYVLKSWTLANGYQQIQIYANGRRKGQLVHRLVLRAFVGEGGSLVARHLNGQPSDNRLCNLRYGTASENTLDSVRHGTHAGLRRKGEAHPLAKLTRGCIARVRDLLRMGHSQREIGEWFGVARTTIQGISNGRRWN